MPDIEWRSGASGRAPRVWLSVLVVAWGAEAIVTQSLLVREALVLMFGSEFAWGVVLSAWLLGVAVGAALGGWLAGRLHRPEVGLVVLLVALSVAACVELWIFRGARAWLGVDAGELLPLAKTALAAMLFVSPASALVGMAFPLACSIGGVARRDRAGSSDLMAASRVGELLEFGQVYALESVGSLIGGAAFSFWAVEHLSPIETALLCGAVTTAAAAALLATSHGTDKRGRLSVAPESSTVAPGQWRSRGVSGPVISVVLGVVALTLVLVGVFAGDALNRRLVLHRWQNVAPGYELVAERESKYQNLAVGERAGQYTLYCDGQVTADFPDAYTFGPLAHFWLCQHPSPRNVLVLGGGAEGLLAEILRHPVAHVDCVEVDPVQIELLRPYLTEKDRKALRDPRVRVHHLDARYYVKMQRGRFDLVIARLPEPTSALRARLYTVEFFSELRRAMTPHGVVGMMATAAPGELSSASREYLASLRATLHRHFPHVVIGWGNPAQVLAATEAGLISTDPVELARRYSQRGVESKLFHPAWFDGATDWLEAGKLARRSADLDRAEVVRISTDLRPSIYMQRLVLWEAVTGGGVGPGRTPSRVLARLRSVGVPELVAVLAAVIAVTLVVYRLRRGAPAGWARGAVVVSVATTGFVTMALSIVWLFAFQSLYGYVYQRIGWIIALFMAGLVIGCLLGQRVGVGSRLTGSTRTSLSPPLGSLGSDCRLWRYLILVDVLLAVLAVAIPFLLPALGALQSGPGTFLLVESCVSIMVVLTGLLGGAAFPLAGRLQLQAGEHAGAAAGIVVGADHAGACLGALLCGILLVPVLGTAVAAYLLAGIKLASVAVLAIGRHLAGDSSGPRSRPTRASGVA